MKKKKETKSKSKKGGVLSSILAGAANKGLSSDAYSYPKKIEKKKPSKKK